MPQVLRIVVLGMMSIGSEGYLQLDTLDDLRYTTPFAIVPSSSRCSTTLEDRLLRRNFLLGLLELLPFLDTRVAHGFGSVRCKTFVGKDGVRESSWSRCWVVVRNDAA